MSAKTLTQERTAVSNIVNWAFFILFIIIGVLNLFLVHPVPGIFYLLLSTLYLPKTNAILKSTIGFSVPMWAKVIIALVILWGTLAVTDLADMAGL